jgi:hypothetical protein
MATTGHPKMHAVGRKLRVVFKAQELDPRDLLRESWELPRVGAPAFAGMCGAAVGC